MKQILARTLCLMLAIVFLWSGAQKLRFPYDFLSDIYQYEILGPNPGMWLAMFLPCLEIILGIAFAFGWFTAGATAITAALGALFTAAQTLALHRQLDISCGCFHDATKVSYLSVFRSTLLIAAAVAIFLLQHAGPAPARPTDD